MDFKQRLVRSWLPLVMPDFQHSVSVAVPFP